MAEFFFFFFIKQDLLCHLISQVNVFLLKNILGICTVQEDNEEERHIFYSVIRRNSKSLGAEPFGPFPNVLNSDGELFRSFNP